MARRGGFRTKTDITGFERHMRTVQAATLDNIDASMSELTDGAEDLAWDLINAQIYDTPPRGGYDRTGALRDSIHAAKDRRGKSVWGLYLGAIGGAAGRIYALYNERGTWGGRVTLQSIQRKAMQTKGIIRLQYGDPKSGLEPRPWIIPTMVMMVREFPNRVRDAVKAAEAAWQAQRR